jgi:hypothetical protein
VGIEWTKINVVERFHEALEEAISRGSMKANSSATRRPVPKNETRPIPEDAPKEKEQP